MSRGAKIAVVILAIVAIVFVVLVFGTGGGGDKRYTDPEEAPALIDAMKELFADESPLAYRETRSPCKRSGDYVVPAGGSCSVSIAGSDAPVRTMTLRLVEGSHARVELSQPGSVSARKTLEGEDREFEIHAFEEPATLEVSCPGLGATCVLRPL